MVVERNDPCPCGSGRKYKHCCLGRVTSPPSGRAADALEEMRCAIEEKEFSSFEEFKTFVQNLGEQHNRRPVDDFCGLSAEQMYDFLYYPFSSPHLVTFPSCLDMPPSSPILKLFELLVEAIGDKGLKPTATGNLPQKFLREAAPAFMGEKRYRERTRYFCIRTETDFLDMHVTRLVAGLSGLIRKYKGKFILSRDCRKLLAQSGLGGIYPRLFEKYTWEFNWGYWDAYPELHLIQDSFLFTLYLLQRFGDEWRQNAFYEDAFLRAFPKVVREVGTVSYDTPEGMVRRCYSSRVLERFAAFLGLVEIRDESDFFLNRRRFDLRKLPLLDEAVIFNL